MSEYRFETHQPVSLYVEVGKGSVKVVATDTTETYVEVTGHDAESVRVEQDGDQISVVAPRSRTGFKRGDDSVHVVATIPADSDLAIRTGSADITVDGTVGTCQVKSGSGEVRLDTLGGPASIETGSGDIRVDEALGEMRIKSGSGDVNIGHAESSVAVSTGSGDVEVGTSNGPAVVKTGSGNLRVVDAQADVSLVTGSGDLVIGSARRGRLTHKSASGDVRIGIPAGTPVWTDISTLSGEIRTNFAGTGEPGAGVDHIELRAKSVSGDILLTQL